MASKLKLAIVGASARAAAQSALRAGFDVVAADLFADEDLKAICPATRILQENYPDGLADWLAAQDVDAWMYTGALENHPDLVDRMAEIKPLWGNRGDALRRVRDPMWLAGLGRGICPKTVSKSDRLPLDGSWLCKTCAHSGGAGTWRLDSDDALRRAQAVGAVFQQQIHGSSASVALSTANDGSYKLLWITEQLVGLSAFNAAPFQYCGSIQFKNIWALVDARVIDTLVKLLPHGFRGVWGIDVVIPTAKGQPMRIVDVNPRYTASMELVEHAPFLSAYPFSAVDAHARCFVSSVRRHAAPVGSLLSGKAILYAKKNTTITNRFNLWAMCNANAGRLADIPAAGTRIEAGQPVLTILEGRPTEGVLERLKIRAAEVESRLYA